MSTSGPAYSLWEDKGRRKVSPPVLLSLVMAQVPLGELGTHCQLHGGQSCSLPQAAHVDAPSQTCLSQKSLRDEGKWHSRAGEGCPRSSEQPCTSLPLPNRPKSQTPHFQEIWQSVCSFSPRAQPAISLPSVRHIKWQQILYLHLFLVETCVLVHKHSHFWEAANVLTGITKSGHPKYMGFAAACLLDLFLSFCYNWCFLRDFRRQCLPLECKTP